MYNPQLVDLVNLLEGALPGPRALEVVARDPLQWVRAYAVGGVPYGVAVVRWRVGELAVSALAEAELRWDAVYAWWTLERILLLRAPFQRVAVSDGTAVVETEVSPGRRTLRVRLADGRTLVLFLDGTVAVEDADARATARPACEEVSP